jgi:hypothetical protein
MCFYRESGAGVTNFSARLDAAEYISQLRTFKLSLPPIYTTKCLDDPALPVATDETIVIAVTTVVVMTDEETTVATDEATTATTRAAIHQSL